MKKLLKVLIILVAIIVVLLIVASIALRIYLPPEKAKKLVLDHLSSQLKREVTLGSVSIGILSGLEMTDLKISESPTFAKGVFLSSQGFTLKVALAPLMFRKVVVREIVLNHPEVSVIRYADGKTFNFSDLTAATTAPVTAPKEEKNESMPFLLLVSRAEIQKAAVHFIDHSPAKQNVDITPLDLVLKNVSLTSPFSVQTDMHVLSKGNDVAIHFAGEANLLDGDFKIKQGDISSQESKITLSGKVSGLKTSAPVVDLNVEIPQLTFSNFKGLVALPPALRVNGAFTGHADLSGDEKTMNFSVLLDGSNADVQYGTVFSKPAKATLTASIGGALKNLAEADIQSLKMTLGALTLSGHGKIPNLKAADPSVVFHIESNVFPIESVLAFAPGSIPAGVTLKGNNKLSADVSGTANNAQFAMKWDGTEMAVTHADDFAKPSGLPMELSVVGQTAGPNKIIIKTLTTKLLSNVVTGAGTYETKGTQSLINFGAKGMNWAVADLAKLSPLADPYHPTGTLSFDLRATGSTAAPQATVQTSADISMANVKNDYYEGHNLQLKWNLTQVTQDLSKVSGTASLKQGPGKISNVDKLAQTSRIGKIALAPLEALAKLQAKGLLKQIDIPSLESIPFDSLVGDYVLHTGIMDIKTFELSSSALDVQDQGTVGLAGTQPINMHVVMKLAAGSIGGTLGEILKDENGRPTVKFTATGTAANPQVKLDLQDTGKKALQQVGQEIMKNQNVQDAVGNALKGIFH